MTPDLLHEHIKKCKAATRKPFGVNLPLLYSGVDKQIDIIISEKVPIVFTSAGNPAIWTETLHRHNIKVIHVVSSGHFAKKAEDCGCDAVLGATVVRAWHRPERSSCAQTCVERAEIPGGRFDAEAVIRLRHMSDGTPPEKI